MNTNTTTPTEAAPKKDLYTIDGVLTSDIEIRSAKTTTGEKPYAYGKITGKNGKSHTIMTFVKSGIAFLTDKKCGESARVFGTFEQQDKGRTFSVMGQSVPRPKAEKPAEDTPVVDEPVEGAPAEEVVA